MVQGGLCVGELILIHRRCIWVTLNLSADMRMFQSLRICDSRAPWPTHWFAALSALRCFGFGWGIVCFFVGCGAVSFLLGGGER